MTYVPPLRVLQRIGDIRRSETTVTMPNEAFDALIRAAFAGAAFDAGWYRATYPDVDRAISQGQVPDEITHFVRFGYFENRRPRAFEVDAPWYGSTYQDVGLAILTGQVKDARSHFNASGYFEPRAPNPQAAAAFTDLLSLAAGQPARADGAVEAQALHGGHVLAARRIHNA